MRRATLLVALLLTLLLALAWTVLAQTGDFNLSWFSVNGGGGASRSRDGTYAVAGTAGQADAGVLANTDSTYTLIGGFWGGATVVEPSSGIRYHIYLPVVSR